MRDANRIYPFLLELGKEWEKVPDWRFGQLLSNVLCTTDRDIFFMEEDEFLKLFKNYFKETE